MIEKVLEKAKKGIKMTEEELEYLEGLTKESYGMRYVRERTPIQEIEIKELESKKLEYGGGLQHSIYEGDNIHTLRHLEGKGEKVEFIYIDPPYNTYKGSTFTYKDKMGTAGDRHSEWLSFMAERLEIAYKLLTDDGVIFISIDDKEVAQLKLLCDSIFGEENYITQFVWVSSARHIEEIGEQEDIKTEGSNLGMYRSSYEYILSYRKTKEFKYGLVESRENEIHSRITKRGNPLGEIVLPKGTRCVSKQLEVYGDVGGESERIELLTGEGVNVEDNKLKYDVVMEGPFANRRMVEAYFAGEEVYDEKGQKLLEVYITATGLPYMRKEKLGEIPNNVLSGYGGTARWGRELDELLGEKGSFSHPKPYPMIQYLLSLHPRKDIRVLDFFAGSGTTGQAVLEQNKKDGGTREFILATNNEYQEDMEVVVIHRETEKRITLKKDGRVGLKGLSELEIYRESEEYKELYTGGYFEEQGICRRVTYPRMEKLMGGYKCKEGKKVEGFGGNLDYKVVELKK